MKDINKRWGKFKEGIDKRNKWLGTLESMQNEIDILSTGFICDDLELTELTDLEVINYHSLSLTLTEELNLND